MILSYAVGGSASWFQIGSGETNAAGEYSIQWGIEASGSFALKAEWGGDADYLGSSNSTTLTVLPYQNQQVFYVESNSTVTGLDFNSTSLTLGFTVSGPTGTIGYTKVTVAKTLAPNFTRIAVFLDGKEINFTVSSSNDYWIITFTYFHSTHQVTINLSEDAEKSTTPVPEFPSWLVLVALVLVAVVVSATIVFMFTRKKPTASPKAE